MVLQLSASASSSRLRKRLATGLLVGVLAWPAAHHMLARGLQLDPWAFFGFAMYSVPNFGVSVRAASLPAPGAEPDWNAVPVSSYRLLTAYAERRARFGVLAPPDELAADLLERHPGIPSVLVRIRRWRISPETSLIEALDRDETFSRATTGSP